MSTKRSVAVVTIVAILVSVATYFVLGTAAPEIVARGVHKIYRETHINGRLTINQKGTDEILRLQDNGTAVWTLADGGEVTSSGGYAFTLGAAEKVALDADTTNHTGTAGVLDIDVGTVTDGAAAINVAVTQDTGTTAAADALGMVMTLTGNDDDGDVMGIKITAAATANAAANTYEYGLLYDCAENTAGACIDGIRLTATTDTGMTDGFDASDAEIVNALNAGANDILFGDDTLDGAVDDTLRYTRNDSGSVTFTCADDDADATCIYDSGGTGEVAIGSADTTNVTVNSDVGLTFANNSESINDTTDATFDFTRDTAGVVTLTCSDDDATAGCVYDAGGASPIVVGSADVTAINLATSGQVTMTIGGAGEWVFTADQLDATNGQLVNIGAAGTDFTATGGLTLADALTISAGGAAVTGGIAGDYITATAHLEADGTLNADGAATFGSTMSIGGDITLENAETLSNSENGVITATVAASGWFAISTGNLVVGDGIAPSLTLNGNDAYIQGTLEADGAARLDGGATVAGNLEISNGLFLPMFDDLTLNDGDWITPTTISIYGLDTSGEVTVTLGVCSYDGQGLTLIGDDANTVNINYVNVRTTDGGPMTIGQYDIIHLFCMDGEWLHAYKSTNQ